MNTRFFPRLAWGGIRKNGKFYLPYILSCIGMVTMFYLLRSLSFCPLLSEMRGGSSTRLCLSLGTFVIAAFSLLFLFYTNSFLIRRRYREFGLYNILGMDKHGIGKIVFWESLSVAGISLAAGLVLGIALSKLTELGLLNMIGAEINYRFRIYPQAIGYTCLIYGIIFLLLLAKSLWQVRKTDPLSLLKSMSLGEKPPRANYVFAIIGVLLLGGAYYLAVSIKTPLTALIIFFIAVLMVIAATYLLFISGSVAFCRILQKNKKYYYKKNHFVSLSQMVSRMKRNGAGLASICILCTMVLVMLTSTSSLYFGAEDSIMSRYPHDCDIEVSLWTLENTKEDRLSALYAGYRELLSENGISPEDEESYAFASISAMRKGTDFDPEANQETLMLDYDNVLSLYFMPVSDYNRIMGTDYTLGAGEVLLFTLRCDYKEDVITMRDMTLHVAQHVDRFPHISDAYTIIVPSLLIAIPDMETLAPIAWLKDYNGFSLLSLYHYYGCDLPADTETEDILRISNAFADVYMDADFLENGEHGYGYSVGSRAAARAGLIEMYGALFFIGIMLSVVFLFAAVMIIYYKQISEGYEDQARFSILKKVGMTNRDIRKSIDSQVLSVFFLPLLFAGLHLSFAFPLVWKILQLFDLDNLRFVILVTVGTFLVFCLFYALIYRLTAHAYFAIVAEDPKE